MLREAQQQLSSLLDRVVAERADLSRELTDLRDRHTQVLVELATLRETTRNELMRAAQARIATEAEIVQTKARLIQLKAEIDDALAAEKRVQELLNNTEADKRNLIEALDASEAARQQMMAIAAAAKATRTGFSSASKSLMPMMTVGAAAYMRSDGCFVVKGRRGGCLCFGPYLDLAAGKYTLGMDFQRPFLAGMIPVRAVIEVVDGNRYLYSSEIKLAGKQTTTELSFDVSPSDQPRQVEFRVLVKRNSFAVLRDLRLEATG